MHGFLLLQCDIQGCDKAKKNSHLSNAIFIKQIRLNANANLIIRNMSMIKNEEK